MKRGGCPIIVPSFKLHVSIGQGILSVCVIELRSIKIDIGIILDRQIYTYIGKGEREKEREGEREKRADSNIHTYIHTQTYWIYSLCSNKNKSASMQSTLTGGQQTGGNKK